MAAAYVHPWWDPEEELRVETTVDHNVQHMCAPCAACGEHTLVTVEMFCREPWRSVLCSRCIKKEGLELHLTCANGHRFGFTVERVRGMQHATELHCKCRAGARRVFAVLRGVAA